jgi:ABC-type antimicrobial peptide transport system permease subunit
LLVAFVGILNAMLMSVTERFREIGTMKCLGALDGFIVRLFLLESFFQGAVGTTIGIIVGLGLSLLGASISYGADAWRNLPMNDVGIAILFCLAVGIGLTIAGAVYPAWTAARMQPIAAMRVET